MPKEYKQRNNMKEEINNNQNQVNNRKGKYFANNEGNK